MGGQRHCVFIAGGTGYMGQKVIARLLERGHEVRALVRAGSERKLPVGCTPVLGNALDGASYAEQISPADTFVQLVGVAHPSPAKAAEFRQVDLPSGLGAVAAAKSARIRHFVYGSFPALPSIKQRPALPCVSRMDTEWARWVMSPSIRPATLWEHSLMAR